VETHWAIARRALGKTPGSEVEALATAAELELEIVFAQAAARAVVPVAEQIGAEIKLAIDKLPAAEAQEAPALSVAAEA